MQSPLEVIDEYYSAFSTLELRAIVSYFCEPCMTVGPKGVFAASNRVELAKGLEAFVDDLRAKGYGHSEYAHPEVTMINADTALARGTAIRYAANGPEMERAEIGYLLHRASGNWRIAVMITSA